MKSIDTNNEFFHKIQNENNTNLIFKDKETLIKIGKWLRLLDDYELYKDCYIDEDMTEKQKMSRAKVSIKYKNIVAQSFCSLLEDIEIEKNENCIIQLVDDNKLIFNIHFQNLNIDYKFSLRYSDINQDHGDEFILYTELEKRVYDFSSINQSLNLQELIKENKENYNKLYYISSPYRYICELSNYNKVLKLDIKYPKTLNEDNINPYLNINKINDKLLNIGFPIELNKLLGIIKEEFSFDLNESPNIKIEVSVFQNSKIEELTDCINLKYGKIVNFAITKGNKIIMLNDEENLNSKISYNIYERNNLYLKKKYKLDSINIFDYDLILKDRTLLHYINTEYIKNQPLELESTKQLIKTILKK